MQMHFVLLFLLISNIFGLYYSFGSGYDLSCNSLAVFIHLFLCKYWDVAWKNAGWKCQDEHKF